jgi:hypothetical protein
MLQIHLKTVLKSSEFQNFELNDSIKVDFLLLSTLTHWIITPWHEKCAARLLALLFNINLQTSHDFAVFQCFHRRKLRKGNPPARQCVIVMYTCLFLVLIKSIFTRVKNGDANHLIFIWYAYRIHRKGFCRLQQGKGIAEKKENQ